MSSPGDDTIRVGALLESSLLGCSSPEGCGSISDSESELSKAEALGVPDKGRGVGCFLGIVHWQGCWDIGMEDPDP